MPGSIIKIKRSDGNAKPPTLKSGEMAYSWGDANSGQGAFPEQLFIGYGVEVNGNAPGIAVIGGKFFTDMLKHVKGKLTASAALVVDDQRKIDQLKTTNITIGKNTTGTVTGIGDNDIRADGLLRLQPSNNFVYIGSMYSLPSTAPSVLGYVLTASNDGTTTWSAPSTSLYVGTDQGDKIQVDILSETFEIFGDTTSGVITTGYAGSVGPGGAYVGSNGNTLKISVRDATTSVKGVASYNGGDFSIDSGTVSLGGSVPRFFTGNDAGYIGSNGAFPVNGEMKIKGNTFSGISTTIVDGNTVSIVGDVASYTQRGTAVFSDTYFYVGTSGEQDVNKRGLVRSKIATDSTLGVAKFSSNNFSVSEQGNVTINLATVSGEAQKPGVIIIDKDQFKISNTGVVTGKSIYLGTTELVLGEGVDPTTGLMVEGGANGVVTGLTSIDVGDIYISGHEIVSTGDSANIDLNLEAKGTGKVKIFDSWYLPGATSGDGSAIENYVLTYNGTSNTTSWKQPAAKLYIRDANYPTREQDIYVDLLSNQLEFSGDANKGIKAGTVGYTGSSGYPGINVSADYSGYSGSTAGTSHVGVASFFSDTFVINDYGGVNVKTGGINNSQLANSQITIGTTSISLGGTATSIGGMNSIQFNSGLDIGYTGSTSITATIGNLYLEAASGKYVKIGPNHWSLPNSIGNTDEVLTSDGEGGTSWKTAPRTQFITTDGTDTLPLLNGGYIGSFKLGTDILNIEGDGVIYTAMTSNGIDPPTIHLAIDLATDEQLGVAKFKDTDFVVGIDGLVELQGTVLQQVKTNAGLAIPYSHNLNAVGYVGSGTFSGAIKTVGYTGSAGGGDSRLDIVARLASDSVTGVASFNKDHFYTGSSSSAVDGAVSARNFYIGSSSFNLGTINTEIHGLTNVTVGNININSNKISSVHPTETYLDIILDPKGDGITQGAVDVSNSRIKNVATPQADQDAVNKLYADALVSGLDVKNSVRAATNVPLNGVYTPSYGYLGSSANWGRLTGVANEALVVDNISMAVGDRVLLKDQGIVFIEGEKATGEVTVTIDAALIVGNEIRITDTISVPKGTKFTTPSGLASVSGLSASTTYYIATDVVASKKFKLASTYANAIGDVTLTITGTPSGTLNNAKLGDAHAAKENGIYVVVDAGGAGVRPWILRRSDDANMGVIDSVPGNVNAGLFTFVEEGNIWVNAGFILITANPIEVGKTSIVFTQFSSAGRILAGDGLDKIGDNISIVASGTSGIIVNADSIEINPTIAGSGLTYLNGIVSVGGTPNRISVGTDAIDIDVNYVGQSSITTVGTIANGAWKGDVINTEYGGTGRSALAKGSLLYGNANGYEGSMSILSISGTAYKVLRVSSDNVPEWSDIDGGEY